jgi:Transposase DDE domain group 1
MMTQGTLPFQYDNEKNESNLTSFSGLPLYLEMAITSGLCAAIEACLTIKQRGWTDLQLIVSLIMLNLAGGDCVEDITRLEADEGLSTLMLKIHTHGMKRKERRDYEKRWRKKHDRVFPSASAIRRYLEQFHNEAEEKKRVIGEAFIPEQNDVLKKLLEINQTMIHFAQEKAPCATATLDQDATLSATQKRTALYCYEKYKAYQPFNTYWEEQKLLLHSEFRDGNVNAGFEQLRILKTCLELLPAEVQKVMIRSDTAGYQQELFEYCAEGKNERFGVIEFTISAKVTPAFKTAVLETKAMWHPLFQEENGVIFPTNQEWAEICFVPSWVGHSKKTPHYRYIAIREPMTPRKAVDLKELPFQTMTLSDQTYKLFALVTNRSLNGQELIHWHYKRCGASEKVHHVEKEELAGGQFPSQKFGANAAWWQIMVLSFNLNALMKKLVFPESLKTKSLKAVRFHIIGVAGRVIQHARGLLVRLSGGEEAIERICQMRQKIMELAIPPPRLSTA